MENADLLADVAENREKTEVASKHLVILHEERWKV
jgi:hypothetical protein